MSSRLHSLFQDWRWSLYQSLQADVHDLLYLFWEATRKCNLSCLHCGSDCTADGHPGLPAGQVVAVLERVHEAYDAANILLVVTGGEPLVRPDLFDVLSAARRMGFVLGLVTNGMLVDGAAAGRLVSVGVQNVVVSLDGPEPIHDWLRNRRGAFRRACRAVRELKAAGVGFVEVVSCVTPRGLDHLEETYEIVRGLGADAWRVFDIFPAGRAAQNPDLVLSADQIRELVDRVAALRMRGKEEGLLVNLSEEGFLGWDHEGRVRDQPYFCRAGINIAGLLADGTIAACPNLPAWMAQGNVAVDDFVDVWENRFGLFRDRTWTRAVEPCAQCPQWRVCRGNSLHLWRRPDSGPAWCHYRILHPDVRQREAAGALGRLVGQVLGFLDGPTLGPRGGGRGGGP